MRRKTQGVLSAEEVVPALIARVEQHDAERVVRLLEPHVLERRAARIKEVVDGRMESVQVAFDAPHDPHNGAAVLRSCEAFGVQRLHVVERREPFLVSPTVSRGAEKWVDIHRYGDAQVAIAHFRSQGLAIVGAHAEGELTPTDLGDPTKVPRFVLVLGNEREGIADDLAAACTHRVRVPMRGMVESLNVSVTAAILLAFATSGRRGDLSEADRTRLYARGLYLTVERAEEILSG